MNIFLAHFVNGIHIQQSFAAVSLTTKRDRERERGGGGGGGLRPKKGRRTAREREAYVNLLN